MTHEGEFEETIESTFSFNKELSVSYSREIGKPAATEVRMGAAGFQRSAIFQMIFVLKGRISFSEKDSSTEGMHIETQQHNLIRIQPQSSRITIMGEEHDGIICINLSLSFLQRYLPASHPAYLQLTSYMAKDKPALLSALNMPVTPEISSILQSIDHSAHSGFCGKLFLESKVIELLALQISQFEHMMASPPHPVLKKEDLEKMQQVREILISHHKEQPSLRTLAHMVGTNEFNLKKNFKAAFGTTVYGYLNQHKMEQAKSMLIEGSSNVSEVSGKMGYKHATHFTSAFKKYFGYLPTKIKMLALLFDPEFLIVLFPMG